MTQGAIDNPVYLVRQMTRLGTSVAGAGAALPGVGAGGLTFPYDVRIRNAVVIPNVQGAAGHGMVVYSTGTVVAFPQGTVTNSIGTLAGTFAGTATFTTTATLGFANLGTATVAAQSGDMNFRLPAGQPLLFKNGTSPTGTYDACIEWHIDPQSGSWTGGT